LIKHWFNQLALRERRALIIGVVGLGILMGHFMFIEPLITARALLENIVSAQKNTLRWMKEAAVEVQQLRHDVGKSPTKIRRQSLLSLIDKSTRNGELDKINKRIEPRGEKEVQVRFKAVSFAALIRWLGQLYNQYQVQVKTISLERQPVSDQVRASLTLKYIENTN
jgi:general secretion pathway protein M